MTGWAQHHKRSAVGQSLHGSLASQCFATMHSQERGALLCFGQPAVAKEESLG
jgi:hypothetical protein